MCLAGVAGPGRRLYKVRLDGGLTLKATLANTTRRLAQPLGWNERVALSWPPEAGMVLTQ